MTALGTSGLTPSRRLGAGGEAEVFEIAELPGQAYKRYRSASTARAAKLRVMIDAPPAGTRDGGHVAIAWPTEIVSGPNGTVEGFLMPRIDLASTVPLFQVYNPATRTRIAPAFTWRYLLRTARNVAAIIASLHEAGYVVGDINESNFLVTKRALAVLVDCDSMQVRDPIAGTVHRGGVGKPEFTAPEFQGRDLASVDRTAESDDFALAVLVFQLLCEGVHPFAGVWRGRGEPPDIPRRMRSGPFPYRRGSRIVAPPHALPLDALPPGVRRLVWRTFTVGRRRPKSRPTAAEWVAALEEAEASLRTCERSAHHVFAPHQRRCPWCARIDRGLPDPFPGPSGRSALQPRPPSRWARSKRVVVAAISGALSRAWSRLSAVVRRRAARAWSATAPVIGSWLPDALVPVLVAALAPTVTAALVGLAFVAPAFRRRAVGWRIAGVDVAVAIASGVALQASVAGAVPTWRPVAATAVAALAFLRRPPTVLGRVRARSRSHPAQNWLVVVAGAALFWWHGPWWWPLP